MVQLATGMTVIVYEYAGMLPPPDLVQVKLAAELLVTPIRATSAAPTGRFAPDPKAPLESVRLQLITVADAVLKLTVAQTTLQSPVPEGGIFAGMVKLATDVPVPNMA